MNRIQILDCTLRDGGYVNDWKFGDENAKNIVTAISKAGADYCELAFIRHCEYQKGKMEFNNMDQITAIFRPSGIKLAAMVEIGYGYPASSFPKRSENTVDLIRLVVWKRMIKESLEYCKVLQDKGYEVCIQATRTEQYSFEEFADFVRVFSMLKPKGIYIVDTFGLLTKERLLKYAEIADKNLTEGMFLGYHAHNNMQQAFSNALAIIEKTWKHNLILDASVMGIGRGSGNLCLELLVKYLNESNGASYNESLIYEVADKYIQPIFNKKPWGYSIPYLLSAKYERNPSYVPYLIEKGISLADMEIVFKTMRDNNVGITYDTNMCDDIIRHL